MAVANGRLDTDDLSPIPAGFHTHGTTAYLRADAAASFLRLAAAFEQRFGKRLVAMSFYRPLSDQVRIFLKNYFRVSRDRSRKTDRTYNGSTYQLRAGMAPVASPGYSNHGLAITVDFNAGVQTRGSAEHDWMLSTGTQYGWDWTEGRRIGEPWHWSYMPSKDRMKGAPKATTPPNNAAAAVTVADLAETQRKLLALGYSPGPLDGSLGPSTRAAVKTYQTDRGLAADGSPGPTTRKALDQDMATLKELDKKVDRLLAFGEQIHWRVDAKLPSLIAELGKTVADIPRRTLQIQVPLEGDQKGQSSNLTGVRKYYAHDVGRIVKLLVDIQKKLTASRSELTDAEVERIADAVVKKIGS